jgi:hypothetical protein
MSTGPATIDLHGRLKGLSPEQRRLFVALLKKEGLDVLRMPIPKAFDSGPVPLSFAQERFWFLQQLTPDSPAYNESLVFRLDGALDRPALERALSEIWRRHEVLRIRIEGSAGALRQVAQPVPATLLPLIDLGGGPQSEREAEALRRIRADSEKAFDPAAGPLYRLALYRLADQRHILCIVLHHLVMDAFALRVLVSELSALYRASRRASHRRCPSRRFNTRTTRVGNARSWARSCSRISWRIGASG